MYLTDSQLPFPTSHAAAVSLDTHTATTAKTIDPTSGAMVMLLGGYTLETDPVTLAPPIPVSASNKTLVFDLQVQY